MKKIKFTHAIYVIVFWILIVLGQLPFFKEEGSWYQKLVDTAFITFFAIPTVIFLLATCVFFLFGFYGGLYKVKKGNHYSGYRLKPFFKELKPDIFKITIWDGWDASEKNGQHNKLIGKNYGFPKYMKINGKYRWVHPNSLRVSFVLKSLGKYDIYYYGYIKGKKLPNLFIGTVEKGDSFYVEISKSTLFQLGNHYNHYKRFNTEQTSFNFGYYLFPYHGGQIPASENCIVDIYKYSSVRSDVKLLY